ncbi:hypothetical protein DSL64_09640 [Dyadobacter luteus]|uniref:Glycosyltransferase family 4 protein n=1 Tax=Dyadobacter luteus TaxID=2259619 RepID=A0A3D8YDH6_9BACT|nr:glycosyltransferase [Dyadobacter luteus]REA62501.1 hypothetical protein DSL64_09640 [Dyadobacter luteus]
MQNTQKFKIVSLVHALSHQGGLQRVAVNLANYWISKGHLVEIWVFKDEPCIYQIDSRVKIKVLVESRPSYPGNKIVKYITDFFRLISGIKAYIKLLKTEKPDIVLIHKSTVHDAFVGFQRLYSKRTLELLHLTFNQHPQMEQFPSYVRYFQSITYKFIQPKKNLVVLNNDVKDTVISSGWKDVTCIFNALPFRSETKSLLDKKYMLAVGRGAPQKGFPILLKAFALIAQKHTDWKLRIIGEGVTHKANELIDIVEQYSLQNQVELIETVSNIKDYYLDSSIFVLSSYYEGMPMALIEAQECGLPIITSDIEGINDVINEDCAVKFDIGNSQQLAEQMERLLLNEPLRKKMAQESIRNARNFYIESIDLKWMELFNATLKKDVN